MAVKFTQKAEKVLLAAGAEAKQRVHSHVGTEHLLRALLGDPESVAVQAAMRSSGLPLEEIEGLVEDALQRTPRKESSREITFTPHAKRCLELASDVAVRWGHFFITTEHLLIGIIHEEEGSASKIFQQVGLESERIEGEIRAMLGEGKESPKDSNYQFVQPQNPKLNVLESFSVDLTEQAALNKLGPVIGRGKEIQRIIQILSRKTKNNPVVLGEPGVGKTAIVEGLAQRIADKDVPEILAGKRVINLDLAAVLAGTKYRGEFEKRIKSIIKEVVEARNIILFIDELHTMMGAGASESSLDASNILKPPLSRGEIQCIGATTLDEYRKHIEKDGAMERRFQVLLVDPPSKEEATEILTGLRDSFEAHHRVRITDEAIRASVELSSRYIADRYLPDKAIDVIDEACSRERLSRTTKPPDFTTLESDISRLEREKDESVHHQDFELAARLRDNVEKMKNKRDLMMLQWKRSAKEIDGEVSAEAVAETVALMTGVPSANLREEETSRLANMEETLGEMVISQDHALELVAKTIRRSRAGLKDPNRPLGSFIFIGPTGVGKTLLAKALARFLFGNEEHLLCLDMSEYMERHSISRLVGSPPGYVGYEEGGQLTERIRRKPYSVILLDEIEKAHPDFANMLLQILEEGRLTDSYGRVVDFKNTILIMTSNLGVSTSLTNSQLGFRPAEDGEENTREKQMIRQELEGHFRPEFLNRLDAVVTFNYLGTDAAQTIFGLELEKVQERLAPREITVRVTDEARDHLLDGSFNERTGARGIRRVIEEHIEDTLSEMILLGEIQTGDVAELIRDENAVKLHVIASPERA